MLQNILLQVLNFMQNKRQQTNRGCHGPGTSVGWTGCFASIFLQHKWGVSLLLSKSSEWPPFIEFPTYQKVCSPYDWSIGSGTGLRNGGVLFWILFITLMRHILFIILGSGIVLTTGIILIAGIDLSTWACGIVLITLESGIVLMTWIVLIALVGGTAPITLEAGIALIVSCVHAGKPT